MSCYDQERDNILRSVIAEIDAASKIAQTDQASLNTIARQLRLAHAAAKISDFQYTVDQERLQRTLLKCKTLLLTLARHRRQAVELLKK